MLQAFFHAWERRLASVTKDRVVRPFEWGLDWIPDNGHAAGAVPADVIDQYVSRVMADTDAFFTPPPTADYTLTPSADGDLLTFPSALTTPHESNNTVRCRYFPARGWDGLKAIPYELDGGRHRSNAGRPGFDGGRPALDGRCPGLDGGRPGLDGGRPGLEDGRPGLDGGRHASEEGQHASDGRRDATDRRRDRSQVDKSYVGHGLQAVPPSRAAVLVIPQWNSDAGGHVGLSKLLAWNGMSALRLSLPYHDQRMPPELHRADYIVSANVMRTLQVCRQAVLDARRAIAWLKAQGYERIGILGSSLGSCLALLTTAHEPLIEAEALNHISPYFADVVWRGLSTAHVREGLDGHIELDLLRAIWNPISPRGYLERLRHRKTLLVYAKYDLTFPVDLSEDLVQAFADQGIPHEVARLRCGHYSIGKAPFKFVDGYILTKFLRKALLQGG